MHLFATILGLKAWIVDSCMRPSVVGKFSSFFIFYKCAQLIKVVKNISYSSFLIVISYFLEV